MSDVVLTQAQFDALKAVCERATELVTTLPYVTMMGGNITRQNINVQALATALEAVKDVDFENVRTLWGIGENGIPTPPAKYFAGQADELRAQFVNPPEYDEISNIPAGTITIGGGLKDKPNATVKRSRTRTAKG